MNRWRLNAVELGVFSNRLEAICDEMGAVLQRSAFSPNIKDRLDFSCAVFDAAGGLSAQAAHIPVHLGSMAYAMSSIVSECQWMEGDMVVVVFVVVVLVVVVFVVVLSLSLCVRRCNLILLLLLLSLSQGC